LAADLIPGEIHVNADLGEVRRLAEWLRARCDEAGVSQTARIDLELAMVEAANNIVEHGCQSGTDEIGLAFQIDCGTAVVTLADRGPPVPPGLYAQCRDMPLEATEGRGIGIVQSCVDVLNYSSHDGLNRLTLTKLL
jgi:serine/threonine-protein kinase RsbW